MAKPAMTAAGPFMVLRPRRRRASLLRSIDRFPSQSGAGPARQAVSRLCAVTAAQPHLICGGAAADERGGDSDRRRRAPRRKAARTHRNRPPPGPAPSGSQSSQPRHSARPCLPRSGSPRLPRPRRRVQDRDHPQPRKPIRPDRTSRSDHKAMKTMFHRHHCPRACYGMSCFRACEWRNSQDRRNFGCPRQASFALISSCSIDKF